MYQTRCPWLNISHISGCKWLLPHGFCVHAVSVGEGQQQSASDAAGRSARHRQQLKSLSIYDSTSWTNQVHELAVITQLTQLTSLVINYAMQSPVDLDHSPAGAAALARIKEAVMALAPNAQSPGLRGLRHLKLRWATPLDMWAEPLHLVSPPVCTGCAAENACMISFCGLPGHIE